MARVNDDALPMKFICFCLIFVAFVDGVFITKVTKDECTQGENRKYYDISHLQCLDCPANSVVNPDGVLCECDSGFQAVDYMYRGGPDLTCRQCPGGTCPPEPTPGPCEDDDNLHGGICFDDPSCNVVTGQPPSDIFAIPLDEGCVESAYFRENLLAAKAMCECYKNYTACQVLGNMCTLSAFSRGGSCVKATSACSLYDKIIDDRGSEWPPNMPMLYYTGRADDITEDDQLATQFTFIESSPSSKLQFRLAKYDLRGNFLGLTNALGGAMQLCGGTDVQLDPAFTFGTYYTQNCEILAIQLWDTRKYQLTFFDPYIEFEDQGETRLFAIPILVDNYLDTSGSKVNTEELSKWQLTRRFYLVDNVATIPQASTTGGSSNTNAQYVFFAKDIEIKVALLSGQEGKITPPVIHITYAQVSLEDASNDEKVSVSFKVTYSMDQFTQLRDFQVAIGVLSSMAVLYAAFRTWVWSKRAGRIAIDFLSLINFVFNAAGALANAFLLVIFGTAFYYLVFFKRQDAVHLVHPTGEIWIHFQGLLCSAFILKTLHLIHLLFMQCTADVFLIDWERPRGIPSADSDKKKSTQAPVSIWRTYFIANEWNELQAVRKINSVFQVIAVVFFLEVVGFVNVNTKEPDGSVRITDNMYRAEQSPIYRFATLTLIYFLVALTQWLFFVFIYERFMEDKVRQFVDLCSMSNISVFIMAHAQYGFYIHGRSVHGKADTDMKDMHEMLKREEADLCGQRGLLPNTEQQTFEMLLPAKLRYKYNQVYLPLSLEKNMQTPAGMEQGRGGSRIAGTHAEKLIKAYTTVNKFLSAFIDHSLRDVDYVIKDKTLMEGILDTEFLEPTDKGVLYNDNGHSFDTVLLYGREMTLCVFEVLLFAVVDLVAMDFVLAGVITYVVSQSLRDVDYVIKDKTLMEGILDTEFLEPTDKGVLYNDNGHSFDTVLLYGREMTLCVFEVLLFAVVDLVAMDFVLAGVITYVVSQSLRDVDYVIKDKTLMEGILDTEFLEPTDKGVLYNDNGHSFDTVLLYGREMTLCVFEVLLFAVVDLVAMDFVLAGVITYVVSQDDDEGREITFEAWLF